MSSTEFVYANGSVEPGPHLPTPLAKMCAVVTSDGQVVVAGGQTDQGPSAKTWVYGGSVAQVRPYFLKLGTRGTRPTFRQ